MSDMSYYRTYEASPIFSFKNSATITAGKQILVDVHKDMPASKKYGAFNNLTVTNNSSYDVYIYLNQDKTNSKVIPSGTILTFDRKTIPALRSLIVYNSGSGTIAINEIEVAVWKEGITQDQAFAKMHKAFFKFFSQSKSRI